MSDDLISRQAVIDLIHLFFTEEVDKIPTKKTSVAPNEMPNTLILPSDKPIAHTTESTITA